MRYFKVKYGFGVSDHVSIEETELPKAIYAQIKGVPVQIGTHYVNGRNIIVIEPHYHKHTGWYDWFEPKDGEDFAQIKRDCPNYDGVIEAYKNQVAGLIEQGKENLIGKKEAMELLPVNVPEEKSQSRTGKIVMISGDII